MQTDEEIQEDIQLYEDDTPELAAFLRRIEPHVYKELQKNRRSHAFDGWHYRLSFVVFQNFTGTVSGLDLMMMMESPVGTMYKLRPSSVDCVSSCGR